MRREWGLFPAKGDGVASSMNNESYSMTGTSMATPMAASFTALLQQHVVEQEGFCSIGAVVAFNARSLGRPDHGR